MYNFRLIEMINVNKENSHWLRVSLCYARNDWGKLLSNISIFEEELKKSLWKRQTLLGDNTTIYLDMPVFAFELMWNGRLNITGTASNVVYIQGAGSGTPYNYFTIDLGVIAKLSRYKLWHRLQQFAFDDINPKKWKVYGSATISSSNDLAYWNEGFKNDWFLLADCQPVKPSGDGPVTPEDLAYAESGFEFDIPFEAPPVRYVRFYIEKTYTGASHTCINEISFWGKVIE